MKLPTFLFVFFFYTAFTQEVKVQGLVVNEENKPISNILISIVTKTNEMLDYQYTSNKGEFNFTLKPTNDSLFIKASSLIYNEEKMLLKKNSKIIFHLTPKIEILNEIVINTNTRNKDTLNLHIEKYAIKENESVEKTLKKIPGISIDKEGKIKYWNKEIEKILIDGEDLANNQYTFISKNLRTAVIEDIQVLKNFEENTVLKKNQKSDKIALNLKVKNTFKNVWFGNINLGYGSDVEKELRLKESLNLGLLRREIKFLDFLSYSSLGNKAVPIIFGENNTDLENNALYSLKTFSNILPDKATNFNKAFSNTFLINKKFKNITFRGTAFIGIDKQKQQITNNINYFLQEGASFIENNNLNNRNNLFFGEGEIKSNNLKKSYFINKFKYKIGANNFNTLTDFNTTNSIINDIYKNNETSFLNYFQYTYDLGNRTVLNNEIKFGISKLNEKSTIKSDILANFLNSNEQINQNIENKFAFLDIKTNISYYLNKKLKSNIAIQYKTNKEDFSTFLTPNNSLFENNITFNRNEINIIPSLIYNVSRKTRLTAKLNTTFFKLNNFKQNAVNYNIKLDTKFLGDITLFHSKKQEFLSNRNFLPNYYLSNNNTFRKGSTFFNSLNYHLFKFQINHKNKLRTFNNEFSIAYKVANSFLLQEYKFTDNINFNNVSIVDKKGEFLTFKEQLIFLVNSIDIGFNIKTLQTFSKLPLGGNINELSNTYVGLYNFEITSYFSSKFNFNLFLEYNKQSQKVYDTNFSFNSKNIVLNLDYNFNKATSLNLNGAIYKVNKNYYNLINFDINYSPKNSNFSYSLSVNNLLNENSFSYQESNSFFFSEESVPLIPFYSFLNVKYIF
ncbi:hypothetical protein [Polaribacter cellanae]|uniref:TonB-dependent receptor n=1 Tax=Polaribacter cellanae TaxID=2818493 RepID=A0A975H893_9FLAO|nr:hypothetical protein [Polaribacter cellanae]QTE21360.1 hypothetical protein J3359_11030 [Polaribacter cellanae]